MKIKKFNEKINIENTEKHLIEKYNVLEESYSVKVITEKYDLYARIDPKDMNFSKDVKSLDDAVNILLQRKIYDEEREKGECKSYHYIIKTTNKTEVMTNEEIQRMIDVKKYNL